MPERALRERLLYFVLTPAIVLAIMVLGWLALRTTLQIEKARQQTVLDATLTLAEERVDVLDKYVVAQDNVVAAHTLRLSAVLLAAGRPHDVLPLSGVTHMTPQEVVAENLLLLHLEWLRRALGLTETPPR